MILPHMVSEVTAATVESHMSNLSHQEQRTDKGELIALVIEGAEGKICFKVHM